MSREVFNLVFVVAGSRSLDLNNDFEGPRVAL